jgi:ABC-type phosphate transport system substrate-binding protein
MRRSVTSVILGVSLLALVACGSNGTTQEATTAPSSTSAAQTTEPLISDTVAQSQIQEVAANIIGTQTTFSLTAALAESPVAFWFWAPG